MTSVRHINPEALAHNPAFTQAIAIEGPHRTIYVGGQNAVDLSKSVVGVGDIAAQSEQAFRNLETALSAAGARLDHVVKMNIYVVQGQNAVAGLAGSRRVWGERPNPPTITVLYVCGLARSEFLIEVDAVAVVPLDRAP